jgi:hypothetical protein
MMIANNTLRIMLLSENHLRIDLADNRNLIILLDKIHILIVHLPIIKGKYFKYNLIKLINYN